MRAALLYGCNGSYLENRSKICLGKMAVVGSLTSTGIGIGRFCSNRHGIISTIRELLLTHKIKVSNP